MSFAVLAILLPLLAAPVLAAFGQPRGGATANLLLSLLVFALTLLAGFAPGLGLVHADALGVIFGTLTGFIGVTTALANLAFVRIGQMAMTLRRWRLYHAMTQAVLGLTLLGLYADDIFLLWGAMVGALLAASFGAGLPGTAKALRAAWSGFILGAVALLLALFGTLLVYLAAQPALGPGLPALSFTTLNQNPARLDGKLLSLAFVLLLVGYGTRAALAPLHFWLPDTTTEGPAPLTASLAAPLLNVPLLAILRFRHLAQASFTAQQIGLPPGPLLMAFGVASLWLAAFSLARRRNARRFLGFAAIGHAGVAAFAFGLGGAAAIFGGLLHMILHTLARAGLAQALIRAALLRAPASAEAPAELLSSAGYGFGRLRGMAATSPVLGGLLGAGLFALTGLPPSGLFVAEYLIVSQTVLRQPWLTLPLALGLLLATVAVLRRIGPLTFGPAPPGVTRRPAGRGLAVMVLQLLLAVLIGFAMPAALTAALGTVAASLA